MIAVNPPSELREFHTRGCWVGMEVRCYDCGFVGRLEWSDRGNVTGGWHYTRHGRGGYYEKRIKCPCGQEARGTCGREEFHQRISWAESVTDMNNILPFQFKEPQTETVNHPAFKVHPVRIERASWWKTILSKI